MDRLPHAAGLFLCVLMINGLANGPAALAQEPLAGNAQADVLKNLLESGSKGEGLPTDFRLRLQADLEKLEKSDGKSRRHRECWEFTADKVFRLQFEKKGKKWEWIRKESRPYNVKKLCRILIDESVVDFKDPKLAEASVLFAGTEFDVGYRDLVISLKDRELIEMCESCLCGGYEKAESLQFTRIFNQLGKLAQKSMERPSK